MKLRRYALIALNALAAMLLIRMMSFHDPPLPEHIPTHALMPAEPQERAPKQPEASGSVSLPLIAEQDDRLRLVGVMLQSGRSAAWVQRGERALRRIVLGDELDGGRVVEISRRSIAVDSAGKRKDYLLDPPSSRSR